MAPIAMAFDCVRMVVQVQLKVYPTMPRVFVVVYCTVFWALYLIHTFAADLFCRAGEYAGVCGGNSGCLVSMPPAKLGAPLLPPLPGLDDECLRRISLLLRALKFLRGESGVQRVAVYPSKILRICRDVGWMFFESDTCHERWVVYFDKRHIVGLLGRSQIEPPASRVPDCVLYVT